MIVYALRIVSSNGVLMEESADGTPESALLSDLRELLQGRVADLQLLDLRPDFDDLHEQIRSHWNLNSRSKLYSCATRPQARAESNPTTVTRVRWMPEPYLSHLVAAVGERADHEQAVEQVERDAVRRQNVVSSPAHKQECTP